MEERSANTWEEFKDQLEELNREHGGSSSERLPLLFRGQEESSWWLRTTLEELCDRMSYTEYYRTIYRIKPQVESLMGREWPIPDYAEIEKLSSDYDSFYSYLRTGARREYPYMAYLRHHGFPSPLLDWTRSPYVAAFFAFNKADDKSDRKVSIFACSTGITFKLHGNNLPLVIRLGPYVNTHRRHFLQQSEYTLCVGFYDKWKFERYRTVFDKGLHQQGTCWKFDIPATERRKVLTELNEYNLNAWSLFGSEESMMETLATKEFCLNAEMGPLDVATPPEEGGAGSLRVRHLRPA